MDGVVVLDWWFVLICYVRVESLIFDRSGGRFSCCLFLDSVYKIVYIL